MTNTPSGMLRGRVLRLLEAGQKWRRSSAQFDSVLGNIGWLMADKALRLLLSVAVGIWVARYLAPERFGELNYALAVVGLLTTFSSMGLNGIVVRDLVREPESSDRVMGAAFLLQFIGGMLATVCVCLLGGYLRAPGSESYYLILILGLIPVLKCSEVAKYWFEARVQSKYSVWVENGALLIGALCRMALIVVGARLSAFGWAALFEAALTAIGLLIAMRALRARVSFRLVWPGRAIRMFRDAWPLLISGLTVILYMRLDTLMLSHMAGNREVGMYAAATRISEVLYLIPSVLVSSLSPAIIRSYNRGSDQYEWGMRQLYFSMAWLAVVATFPIAIFANFLVRFVYGIEYASAGPILAIHLWASVAVFIGVASSQHLLVDGKQKLSLWRTLIGLICNVLLNLLLIPKMGAQGAALATVVAYFVATYSLVLFKSTRQHALLMTFSPFMNPIRQ